MHVLSLRDNVLNANMDLLAQVATVASSAGLNGSCLTEHATVLALLASINTMAGTAHALLNHST